MDFDNRLFCVNGKSKKRFELAIRLLMASEYEKEYTATGWYFHKDKGFVLVWSCKEDKANIFTNRLGQPFPPTTEELIEILWEWLKSDEAKTVTTNVDWEENFDHDGSNGLGWKVYTEEWGHIHSIGQDLADHYSFAAVKPVYLWYGK